MYSTKASTSCLEADSSATVGWVSDRLTSVERDDDELGALCATLVVDGLVVIDSGTAVTRSGDNASGTASQETLEDLDTDAALADTSKQGGLLCKRCSVGGNVCQDVKVDVGELLRVGPVCAGLALEVKERKVG